MFENTTARKHASIVLEVSRSLKNTSTYSNAVIENFNVDAAINKGAIFMIVLASLSDSSELFLPNNITSH